MSWTRSLAPTLLAVISIAAVTGSASAAAVLPPPVDPSDPSGYIGQAQQQQKPILGVEVSPTTTSSQQINNLDNKQGLLVRQVFTNTAAARMGIQPGDVILTINGTPTNSMNTLRTEIGLSTIGEPVQVVVKRRGQTLAIGDRLGQWPSGVPFTPIDSAAEDAFRHWQDNYTQRVKDEADALSRQVDELEDYLLHPPAAKPDDDMSPAMRSALAMLQLLPAWRIQIEQRFDAAEFPAPTETVASADAIASTAANKAPWSLHVDYDSNHPSF